MSLLETTALGRDFERAGKFFSAVRDVSFCVEAGDFVTIFGRSGSGKTTLIGMIAGLIDPTRGSIRLNGQDVTALDDGQASRLRNVGLGYVPQGAGLLGHLSVLDNVRLPFFLGERRKGDGVARAMDLLDAVGISHLADAYPQFLSGGEMRRVAIARAMMNDPVLLLADEPTSDLDMETTHEIISVLRRLNEGGTTFLIVTHDSEFTNAANRVLRMDRGMLSVERTPGAVPI